VAAKATEFAPGIPAGRAVAPLPSVKDPEQWEFAIQRHLAERAGEHFDLRLVDPKTQQAHSWALRHLPKPGERRLAVQQPTHTADYALKFQGHIESEYGRGDVELARRDRAEVLRAGDEEVRFNLYPGKEIEEYALRRTGGDRWLLQNVTTSRQAGPGRALPSSKPAYKTKQPDQLQVEDPNTELQAKIDGAHVLYSFKKPGQTPRVVSYRPAERATGVIEHTHKLPGFQALRTPPALRDTILRGELYAVDEAGKALPAARVGGLLNAGVWRSREKQQQEGQLVPVAFDVVQYRGKNVENEPYGTKKKILDTVYKLAPWLKKPRTAETPSEKAALIEDIREGREPSTEEGVIEWRLDRPVPAKSKFLEERDVFVRRVFPEAGTKRQGTLAGGFEFSTSPRGPLVGRVGTGFSHALKRDMLENPSKYEGLRARVKVQRAPAHYAPRAAAFHSFHLDQDMPEEIKTAKKERYRPVAGVQLRKAIPLLRKLPTDPDEAKAAIRGGIEVSRDIWSHPQVAVPVKKLDLERLGFKPTRWHIPIPGESLGAHSWRSGKLHAHKSGPLYLIHEDVASLKEGLTHAFVDVPKAVWSRMTVGPAVKTAAATATLRPHEAGGIAIEKLSVPAGERGQGKARELISYIKDKYKGANIHIRPRPFGDMPMSIDQLRSFYESEGFRATDGRDNMMLKSAATAQAQGWWRGDPMSPGGVKFKREFQGITIHIDRPKGFVMMGKDEKGNPWARKYQYDYGFIPRAKGGDGEGLDVFLGPEKKAAEAYWAVQMKPDGSFDEYKVFLGFPNREAALSAYRQHIPKKLLKGMVTMRLSMMKTLMGIEPQGNAPIEEAVKSAQMFMPYSSTERPQEGQVMMALRQMQEMARPVQGFTRPGLSRNLVQAAQELAPSMPSTQLGFLMPQPSGR